MELFGMVLQIIINVRVKVLYQIMYGRIRSIHDYILKAMTFSCFLAKESILSILEIY